MTSEARARDKGLFRRLVVGVELSLGGNQLGDGSRRAVDQALQLARHSGGRITLLHSTHADEHFDARRGARLWVEREGLAPRGRAVLGALVEQLEGEGVEAKLELVRERAWVAMCKHVCRTESDLVIVGKREHSDFDFDRRRLGAVAIKLLRKCPCPVWTVGPQGRRALRKVLAATDLTPVGDRVVRKAAALARLFQAELHIVHACQLSLIDAVLHKSVDREPRLDEDRARAERRLRERVEQLRAQEADLHVAIGSPTGTIIEAIQSLDPDLLVLGSISRSGLRAALVGNTAERIFGLVARSLLTLKPEGYRPQILP